MHARTYARMHAFTHARTPRTSMYTLLRVTKRVCQNGKSVRMYDERERLMKERDTKWHDFVLSSLWLDINTIKKEYVDIFLCISSAQ